ncbi:pentapeptide repeat-containing protein [Streptomyces fenghuangensis]
MSAPPPPVPEAPSWPHCAHGADPATDPVGCRGVHVSGHTACLAHLADADRDAYLAGLTPGADIDHRGTTFTGPLLNALLGALRDPNTRHAHFGEARFGSATFQSDAWFGSVTFQGDAGFDWATFQGNARFVSATFQGNAWFESATFQGAARFESATFQRDARFAQAVFERWVSLGPFVCAGRVWLSGAVFNGPANLSFAARRLECRRTRWLSTAELRLRYATVDFAHAVFEYPLTIAAEPDPFVLTDGRTMEEQALAHAPDAAVRIATLRGVDAAHLVLADVDLSACLFTGTVHLDQLRLEGACAFDAVPPGTHRRRGRPVRFTGRRTLAEEHHWRAKRPDAVRGWNVAVLGAGHAGPAQLAPVYRALRKAFEDGKDEPGAADFYYGEMGAA